MSAAQRDAWKSDHVDHAENQGRDYSKRRVRAPTPMLDTLRSWSPYKRDSKSVNWRSTERDPKNLTSRKEAPSHDFVLCIRLGLNSVFDPVLPWTLEVAGVRDKISNDFEKNPGADGRTVEKLIGLR
jgi:hypothetical protein